MHYKFFQNNQCEFFPCHEMENLEDFNCLFCYCPLYMLGKDCGGNVYYTPHGIKDCSKCVIPHIKDISYDHIQKKMLTVIEQVQQEHLEEKK